jgi:vacuolar-type H+-ATPase subunit D/Vma8
VKETARQEAIGAGGAVRARLLEENQQLRKDLAHERETNTRALKDLEVAKAQLQQAEASSATERAVRIAARRASIAETTLVTFSDNPTQWFMLIGRGHVRE